MHSSILFTKVTIMGYKLYFSELALASGRESWFSAVLWWLVLGNDGSKAKAELLSLSDDDSGAEQGAAADCRSPPPAQPPPSVADDLTWVNVFRPVVDRRRAGDVFATLPIRTSTYATATPAQTRGMSRGTVALLPPAG